jgi:hypothetical protein
MISATSTTRHADSNRSIPLRTKSVTDVSGINRNLCVRNGPDADGVGGWIQTSSRLAPIQPLILQGKSCKNSPRVRPARTCVILRTQFGYQPTRSPIIPMCFGLYYPVTGGALTGVGYLGVETVLYYRQKSPNLKKFGVCGTRFGQQMKIHAPSDPGPSNPPTTYTAYGSTNTGDLNLLGASMTKTLVPFAPAPVTSIRAGMSETEVWP